MKNFRRIWASLLAGAVGAWACTAPALPSPDDSGDLAISLSLSVGRTESPSTRMTDAIVQNSGETSFRGIEQVYAIPFLVDDRIQADDPRFGGNLVLPQQGLPANEFGSDAQGGSYAGLVRNNNAHLYNPVFVPRGTCSMLVYGKAIDEPVSVLTDSVAFKSANGILRARGLEDGALAGGIHFDLDPMTDGEALAAELETLLGYLNAIAQTSVTYGGEVYRWSDRARAGLQDAFSSAYRQFISEGRPFAGSSLALGQLLTRVYRSLYPLKTATGATGALATAILDKLVDAQFVTVTGNGAGATVSLNSAFPTRYGLPAGAVTLQWNGTAFWRPTRAAGSQAVTLSSFCYPPSLWYYTNSRLAVSTEEDLPDQYNETHSSWRDITGLYSYHSLVSTGVKSVAVRNPLQYGVALLDVYVNRVTKLSLPDSKSNSIPVNNLSFPLTGIIVGDQRNLSFDFTPTGDDIYYVYDREVNNGTVPKAWISSEIGGLTRLDIQVLTTQTLPLEDLHLALEFQNNSGSDFYGHDGDLILAGSRFYLFARLKYADAVNKSGESIDCILLQDHATRVTFSVVSLEEAYSTIPEMKSPQLQVGVLADVEWILSTPVGIPVK